MKKKILSLYGNISVKRVSLSMVLAIVLFAVGGYHFARAASLSSLSDTMTRLLENTASDHAIQFTTSTAISSGTITVTFPSDFDTTGVDYTDIDLSYGAGGTENDQTLDSSAGVATWGAAFGGTGSRTLTLTYPTSGGTAITGGWIVIVQIGTNASGGGSNAQMTNPTTDGTYVIDIDTGSDTGSVAVAILDSATPDQFTVTATVDPTITLALSATSMDFGTLSSSSVTTASPSITVTVSTNADNGYTVTVQDEGDGTNPGLYNSTAAYTIGSADYSYGNTADLSSVAGYGIQASSATATIDSRYDQSSDSVGGFERTAQTLATYASPASSQTISITAKAKVSGATSAGSYQDTVTVIATGNF